LSFRIMFYNYVYALYSVNDVILILEFDY
jgi:hypothetical protein